MHPVDMAGTRIRERRIIRGLKQAELAHAAGISASYLNLIEHNRRRIGGRTLLQIAEVLEVEPTLIREGVQTSLLTTLREIAKQVPPPVNEERELEPELDRVEEFAGRFPGWAQLIANLNNQNSELQQNVNFLTERLSNDPKLSDALHEVISTVTAIRSTASILADTRELEPEWLMRFHRNINEDGKRLAQGAETLVKYLEGGPNADSDVLAPVEEVEAFLAHHSYHFAELEQDLGQEGDAEQCLDQLIAESDFIVSEDATHLARRILGQYVCDAQELPIAVMADLISMHKIDPETIIRETGAPMAQVLRRIAMLPEQITGATGLVSVTTSGMLLPRKPMLGINLPRTPTGCAFWPLHRVMAHPERPVRAAMRQDEFRITAMAAAEQESAAGFDTSGTCTAYMLLLPEISAPESNAPLDLKEICSVCGRKDCVAPH